MSTQDAKERLELLQGTLDLLILRTLIFGSQHGQGIARAIQQTSQEELLVEHGALYPALQRLEERGWIFAKWGISSNNRKARFYSLTAVRRKRKLGDFTSEIEAHIHVEIERLRERGLSEGEARATAHRSFGNIMHVEERFYESGRWLGWDHFWHDIRYALRMLRKSPGFTALTVLTIALGIGATTAIFSVVDATLLTPLPYPQPEQLVTIQDDLPGVGAQDVGLSEPEWQDLQRSGIFEYVSPAWFDENNLTGLSQPARVRLLIVAPNYFALLGVKPQLGRAFNPEDHSPGLILEVLISDGLWKRAFGSDPHILDQSIRLDTDLYRIVGVMPRGFDAPGRTAEEKNIA